MNLKTTLLIVYKPGQLVKEITIPTLLYYLTPIFLYAETHYSFKGIFSRLKKKEPEIVADVPFRIEPDQAVPLLVLCKDAHLFPILLQQIEVSLIQQEKVVFKQLFKLNERINQKFWFRILDLALNERPYGPVKIDIAIQIKMNGQTRVYHNDNYRISSHFPFDTYLANDPLPRLENLVWGDLHYHSAYTEDQVEFGAPLAATLRLARAMGCHFFAVTDHSYDLDDCEDDVLQNDGHLPKWQKMNAEVEELNQQYDNFCIIPGEEVSCGNSKNKNVHFLILNNRQFFPGKGDGAEKWFHTRPDLTIPHILNNLETESLAYAAHPEVEPPLLQKILIRRGKWEQADYLHHRLTGMQIWNGRDDHFFQQGMKQWIKLLLQGTKLKIVAGNDAHGNFNRFRQIGFPFWTFRENRHEIFGYARTGVWLDQKMSKDAVLAGLRKGLNIISNGPLLWFEAIDDGGIQLKIGEHASGAIRKLWIKARSTDEFGQLTHLKLVGGEIGARSEKEILTVNHFPVPFHYEEMCEIEFGPKQGYIRGELLTQKEGKNYRCLTNPLWIGDTTL